MRIISQEDIPLVGIYCLATDRFALVPESFFLRSKSFIERVRRCLDVPLIPTSVYHSPLIGMFSCGNSNGILVTSLSEPLRGIPQDIPVTLMHTLDNYTALGNLILANNRGAVIASGFCNESERIIEKALGVSVCRSTIAGLETVGRCGIATDDGALVHPEATEEEIKTIEKTLGVTVGVGTLNRGNAFVGACGIANVNGALVGSATTPVEVSRFEAAMQGNPLEE